MLNFEQAYSSAEHHIYSRPNKVALLRNHINYIAEYIYSVYLSYPEKSLDEIIDFIYDDFENSSKVPLINPFIHYSSIRYEACKYLINNPSKVEELLETIKTKSLKDTRTNKDDPNVVPKGFSGDFEESLLYFALYEKSDFDTYLSEFSEEEIDFVKTHIDVLRKNLGGIPYVTRMFLEKSIPLVVGSYSKRFRAYLEQNEAKYEKELKRSLATSISSLAKTLDKYGLLQSSCDSYNIQMEELGMPELSIPENSSKNNPNLLSLLSEGYLVGLPLEQLLLLNHFYINRISKEFEKIKDGLFVIEDLNLYDDIIARKGNNVGYSIDSDTIYEELLKMQVLQMAANDYYAQMPNDLSELANTLEADSTVRHSSILANARKLWNKKYVDTFYPDIPLEDRKKYLSYDLSFYLNLHDPIYASYVYKDHSSTAIMAHLLHSKKLVNWGYIPEFNPYGENTISAGNKFILIGVDCEGLNRPVFTHEISSKLRDFFTTYTEKPLIPIYEGMEDFTAPEHIQSKHPSAYANTDILKNNIIAPFSVKHKKFIKSAKKLEISQASASRLISHIEFLRCHSNFPAHLKTATQNPDTGELTFSKPNRFVALDTGEFYEELNGELIPLQNISLSSKGVLKTDDTERI